MKRDPFLGQKGGQKMLRRERGKREEERRGEERRANTDNNSHWKLIEISGEDK
jgi:hypothetical protein